MALRNSKGVSEQAATPAAAPSAPQQAEPAKPAAPRALSAQDALRAVIAPGTPVRSGRSELRIDMRETTGKRRTTRSVLTTRFNRGSGAGLPSFAAREAEVTNGRRRVVRAVATGKQGYYSTGARFFELSDGPLRATERVRRALSGSGSGTAKASGLDPASWVKGLKAAPGGKLDGVDTTRVSGRIDSKLLLRDVKRAVRSAGGAAQGAAAPAGFYRAVERSFGRARIDAWVGNSDRIARRTRLAFSDSAPQRLLGGGPNARGRGAVTLELTNVNKPARIEAPSEVAGKSPTGARARRATNGFLAYSVIADPPAGVLQLSLGLARLNSQARSARVPRAVERAVKADRRVVIFFSQSGGVDDPMTARAVRRLGGGSKLAVFSDRVDNVAAYGQVVQSVGVTRAPSVVIIGSDEKARLIEGYVDPQTLAQEVADTR